MKENNPMRIQQKHKIYIDSRDRQKAKIKC